MRKKLTKSKNNVVLTGTLAGIAEYFSIDPTIVRIIYVFLSLTFLGAPVLFYVVLAVLIPADKSRNTSDYGHQNRYYQNNNYKRQANSRPRKEAEKVEEDDWSDF